jgi:hypothetical protein
MFPIQEFWDPFSFIFILSENLSEIQNFYYCETFFSFKILITLKNMKDIFENKNFLICKQYLFLMNH